MSKQPRVLVAMSGGVDSSVAACLLLEQGYDVVGVFMRLGAENQAATPDTDAEPCKSDRGARGLSLPIAGGRSTTTDKARSKGCCSASDATDARSVAARLGIAFYALNFERDFGRLVDYFVDEYARSRTPNPCIRCNQWLKFGRLTEYAGVVGADFIATGHYARVLHEADRARLCRAAFHEKDQSYVLFGIAPDVLRRTLFPLGAMTKSEVRSHARRFGLDLHDKPESQDICFVPDGDYARLIRSRRADAFTAGDIRHVDGRLLGQHEGLVNFTVGQRRGLRVAVGSPIYVTELEPTTGTLVVGPRSAVYTSTVRVSGINWLTTHPEGPIQADIQIRYHHAAARGTITPGEGGRCAFIQFDEPQAAITPGQAAVFYQGDEVIGGGWIDGK